MPPTRVPALRDRPLIAAALALLGGAWLLLAVSLWSVCDDAYISFRYARNLAEGHGLRYNLAGEVPVEGYSNLLWVLLAAVIEAVGLSPVVLVPVASAACAAALLWRVWATARGALALSPSASVMAVAFLALSPSFSMWSSSGLETMPAALLLFLAFEALFLWRRGDAWAWGALWAVGLALIRAEGFTWALLLAAVSPHRARALPLVGASVAALFGWRRITYGQWVPNTVTAKVGLSAPVVLRGLRYFAAVQLTLLTPLAALLGTGALLRRIGGWPSQLAAGLLVLGGLAWPISVGGDFMPMGRLFLGVLPLLALAWAAGLARAPRWGWLLAAGLLAVGVMPAFDRHAVPEPVRAVFNYRLNKAYRSEHATWRKERDQVQVLRKVGERLAAHTPPGTSVVAGAIGALGYASRREIFDRYGLVTPEVARRPLDPSSLTTPGHDKAVDVFYFVKDAPDILFAALLTREDVQNPAALLEKTRPFAADLLGRQLQAHYAPVVLRGEEGGLFVLQKVPTGADPAAAWEAYTRAVGLESAVQRNP